MAGGVYVDQGAGKLKRLWEVHCVSCGISVSEGPQCLSKYNCCLSLKKWMASHSNMRIPVLWLGSVSAIKIKPTPLCAYGNHFLGSFSLPHLSVTADWGKSRICWFRRFHYHPTFFWRTGRWHRNPEPGLFLIHRFASMWVLNLFWMPRRLFWGHPGCLAKKNPRNFRFSGGNWKLHF